MIVATPTRIRTKDRLPIRLKNWRCAEYDRWFLAFTTLGSTPRGLSTYGILEWCNTSPEDFGPGESVQV
ncbi:hypothetical protein FHL15_010096 [Xylaria flabelliformis]|uniref:Uncharacterized protein n=1 Tax=Xylaria flabelliformis TaxID=2512241 RepID=A0A553HLY8_9PEZI|nr:hypothetical protein FHL15_010096 [Xylaria flabelliformis]